MNWFWIFNGLIAIFLVITFFRIAVELREKPVQKGRLAFECFWAMVLVVLLLYNFQII